MEKDYKSLAFIGDVTSNKKRTNRSSKEEMGGRKKKRAKFIYNGRNFLWYWKNDIRLRIYSEDKKFVVEYLHPIPFGSDSLDDLLIINGQEFPKVDIKKRPIATKLPTEITSKLGKSIGKFVRSILEWSYDQTDKLKEKDIRYPNIET